jgi:4-amino-4-deoxy-L-arabinose transferase-like glycosyltransferase
MTDVRLERKGHHVSTFFWLVLSVLYLTLFVLLGLATLRKGHTVRFLFGIIFPVLWIIGALLGPTEHVMTTEARSSLQ